MGERGREYPSGEDCARIHKNSIQDLKSWFDAAIKHSEEYVRPDPPDKHSDHVK